MIFAQGEGGGPTHTTAERGPTPHRSSPHSYPAPRVSAQDCESGLGASGPPTPRPLPAAATSTKVCSPQLLMATHAAGPGGLDPGDAAGPDGAA